MTQPSDALTVHELTEMVYEHVYGWKEQQMGDQGGMWKKPDGHLMVLELLHTARSWGQLYEYLCTKYASVQLHYDSGIHSIQMWRDGKVIFARDPELWRALAIAALKGVYVVTWLKEK